MKIKLITDSASDLNIDYVRENNIAVASLEVNIKGEFVQDDLGQTLKYDDFYKLLREGEMTSTSQVNIHTFEELFQMYIEEGCAIIYIGLSGVLSGTMNSAQVAKANVLEKYPDADISLIDSKSAAIGEGALVYYACELLKEGKSKEEVVDWVETHKTKMIHAITVDDLGYLKRGGRISGATSVVGTLLNIKPTLKVDEDGSVVPNGKVKGSKSALRYLATQVKERGIDLENQIIFICHGDDKERAEALEAMIREENQVKDVWVNTIGAVVGTHVGPGAIGAIFLGSER